MISSKQSGRSLTDSNMMQPRFGATLGSAAIAAAVLACGVGISVPSGTAIASAVALPVANPISLTGYNQDSVVENTYTVTSGGYIPSTIGVPFDSGNGYAGNVLYESGLLQASGTPYKQGLPASGQFTGGAFNAEFNVSFQFQNYTNTNNALTLSGTPNEITGTPNGNTGTLTMTTPASYDGLAILAMGARGGGPGQVTLNFSDGTSVTTDYAVQDWFSGTTNTYTPDGNPYGYAISNFGRIATTNSSGGTGAHMDETILNLADLSNGTTVGNYTGEQITSLTFQQAPGSNPTPTSADPNGGSSNIFAVSGFTTALPVITPQPMMSPIAVTGFNQDSVVENTYTVTSKTAIPTNIAVPLSPKDTYALFEAGPTMNGGSYGLPSSGQFTGNFAGVTSVVGGPASFQLQGYTNANNVLDLQNSASGTLTLATAGKFSSLAIVAFSDSGKNNSTGTVTLNFADGTSVTTDFGAPDWYSGGSGGTPDGNQYGVVATNLGRINTTNSGYNGGVDAYETILNLANLSNGTTIGNYSNELLTSLTFTGVSSTTNFTAIAGISGLAAVPEPATLGLFACAAGALLLLRRRNAKT